RTEQDPRQQRYWEGNQRGLRRNHHGEAFGTADEHDRWSRLVHDRAPDLRRLGQGYLGGLRFGMTIETRQDLIRALLRQRGWTRGDLAEQLGVGSTSVSRYLMEGENRSEPNAQAWRLILAMWHDPAFLPAELDDPTAT